jgi:diacylglycerol O-acyltransferase
MRQLTSLDVQFLAAEDGRTHGHVSAVSILDPATAPDGTITLADIAPRVSPAASLVAPAALAAR